jgi:hypothetical protein
LSLIETKWMLPLSDRFSRRMMPPACPYESRGLYSQQTIAQACASNEIEASRGVKNRDNLLNIEPILYTYMEQAASRQTAEAVHFRSGVLLS